MKQSFEALLVSRTLVAKEWRTGLALVCDCFRADRREKRHYLRDRAAVASHCYGSFDLQLLLVRCCGDVEVEFLPATMGAGYSLGCRRVPAVLQPGSLKPERRVREEANLDWRIGNPASNPLEPQSGSAQSGQSSLSLFVKVRSQLVALPWLRLTAHRVHPLWLP